MAVKTLKPTSPGRRFMTVLTFDEITKTEPEKRLVVTKKRTGGRNSYGRITTRHIGGGHKRKIRLVDFRREKRGIPAKVAAIEYDPNRSARLALLHYRDGDKRAGRESRPRERHHRQGRALPLARHPAHGPWGGDEPRRSPDGRRRGQGQGEPPDDAVGEADQGREDAAAEAIRSLHRVAAEEVGWDARSRRGRSSTST